MAEVKSQYRQLAKRYHPDLHGNDSQSQEKFRRVHAAYEFLSDPERKAAYDRRMASAVFGTAPKPAAPPPAKTVARPASKPAAQATRLRPVRLPDYPLPPRNSLAALGEIKASPSVWFGGTAIAIVLLLGIGFCWENGAGEYESHPGAVYGFSVAPAPSQLEPGGASPSPESAPPDVTPQAVPDDPPNSIPISLLPLPVPIHRTASAKRGHKLPLMNITKEEVPVSRAPTEDDLPKTIPTHTVPTGEVVQPLLARYRAVVPKVDRLINQGYALCDADQNDRRTQQLKTDLAKLNTVRDRVRPEIERLPKRADTQELSREVKPILADLQELEASPQPVREDIQTLAAQPVFHLQ